MSYKETLATMQSSMLLEAAVEAETLQESPLDVVMHEMEVLGIHHNALTNGRDPLVLLLEKEEHGNFSYYDFIIG